MENRLTEIVNEVSRLYKLNQKIAKKEGYYLAIALPHTDKINQLIKEFESYGKDWDKDCYNYLK